VKLWKNKLTEVESKVDGVIIHSRIIDYIAARIWTQVLVAAAIQSSVLSTLPYKYVPIFCNRLPNLPSDLQRS
jgi:hypothetical protein